MPDVLSPAACPSAPPSTPRPTPVPEDVQDGVFRLAAVSETLELAPRAQLTMGSVASSDEDSPGLLPMGGMYSPQVYAQVFASQATPTPLTSAEPLPVHTVRGVAAFEPPYSPYGFDGGQGPTDADGAPEAAILYPRPNYGVLRHDLLARYATYRSPGSYSLSEALVDTETEGLLTREGLPTVLPIPPRGGAATPSATGGVFAATPSTTGGVFAATPSTPGGAFADMAIERGRGMVRSNVSGTSGLNVLAEAASRLEYSNVQPDPDSTMDTEDGEVTPGRSDSPVAGNSIQTDDALHRDRPVPGVDMTPEVFARQQQELIALQLAHDEARAQSAMARRPKAQFYSRFQPRSPSIDPVLLMGYAPMEVDGYPAPRAPLVHARVAGSVSSENDLYLPPPLEDNRPDDPLNAPRVPHIYGGLEVVGPTLASGEAQYTHDVPIRNSAAVSPAVAGASGNIPQIWCSPDHVEDARHLAGGHAAPPQHNLMPPTIPLVSFTIIPLSGSPPIHFDDPETLIKGLASERVHVIFRQPQGSLVLIKIFNGGTPRASNVKHQSDVLAESVTAATGAENFIVVPPAQACGQELSLQDQPTTWIILRLEPEKARMLIEQRVWSSKKVSFLAFNRDLRFDRFIGRVGYYTHNVDGNIETSIRKTFEGPLILPSIKSLVASHPGIAPVNVDATVLRVLDSIRVEVVTYPNGNIVAKVYCDSPTQSIDSWRLWVAYVHTVPMWSDLNPTGSFLRPIRCAGCSAADHPTFSCPVALIPGWNGPTPGAATIEGPATATLPGAPPVGRGYGTRGLHPYRGAGSRGRRGRGRGAPPF
ncbi:hypothetical protein C8T65DRAFT_735925 [Cerioporus squamosus]|nr:hypothetical protein C8T65DRAFT_735925 [Cerioporus squamosus]